MPLSAPSAVAAMKSPEPQMTLLDNDNVPPPLSSKWPRERAWKLVRGNIVKTKKMVDLPPCIVVPAKVFEDTCRQWAKHHGYPPSEKTSKRGLIVEEMHVFTDTGLPVPATRSAKEMFKKNARRTEFLIRFSYKKQFFFMWRVTWLYVIRNNDFK